MCHSTRSTMRFLLPQYCLAVNSWSRHLRYAWTDNARAVSPKAGNDSSQKHAKVENAEGSACLKFKEIPVCTCDKLWCRVLATEEQEVELLGATGWDCCCQANGLLGLAYLVWLLRASICVGVGSFSVQVMAAIQWIRLGRYRAPHDNHRICRRQNSNKIIQEMSAMNHAN